MHYYFTSSEENIQENLQTRELYPLVQINNFSWRGFWGQSYLTLYENFVKGCDNRVGTISALSAAALVEVTKSERHFKKQDTRNVTRNN